MQYKMERRKESAKYRHELILASMASQKNPATDTRHHVKV